MHAEQVAMEKGKKAIILKSPSSADGHDSYVDALTELGISAVCVPVLDFSFTNLDKLWKALCKPDEYSGLILTSPRVVESISRAIKQADDENTWQNLLSSWRQKHAFVIGEATASATERLGLVTLGASTGSAEMLVPVILEASHSGQLPLLFPCGNLRREVIPKHLSEHDIPFESITTYETIRHPDVVMNLTNACSGTHPDFIVFYSPSGVGYVLPILEELGIDIGRIKIIAIGPTTGESLEKALHNTSIAVARKPTPSDLKSVVLSVSDS